MHQVRYLCIQYRSRSIGSKLRTGRLNGCFQPVFLLPFSPRCLNCAWFSSSALIPSVLVRLSYGFFRSFALLLFFPVSSYLILKKYFTVDSIFLRRVAFASSFFFVTIIFSTLSNLDTLFSDLTDRPAPLVRMQLIIFISSVFTGPSI